MMSDSHSHGDSTERTTISTRVGPARLGYVESFCRNHRESKAALLRRLIRLHEASMNGNLRCEHCGGAVDLEP